MFTRISSKALTVVVFAAAVVGQGTTTRVSVSSSGAEASASYYPACAISADGRFVAFLSNSTSIVPGLPGGGARVYVRDRLYSSTMLMSVRSDGWVSTGSCDEIAITANGAVVAFVYSGNDLDPVTTGSGGSNVFLRFWQTNSTQLISLASTGIVPNATCRHPGISSDARIVSFQSTATNLVPGDNNNRSDIFVKDRVTSILTRASISAGGAEGNGDSRNAVLSADGRYVVFESDASNLAPQPVAFVPTIYVHDRTTVTTSAVVVSAIGQVPNGPSYSPAVSADGRFVAYQSSASNLVANDLNARDDIFVYDRQLGVTSRVSLSSLGAEALGHCYDATLSGDGRFVCFISLASNLVPGDTWGFEDVFVRDRLLSTTTRVSVDSFGTQANGTTYSAVVSGDAAHIAFLSAGANLISNDTNSQTDCFVHSFGCPPPQTYCTPGTSTNGCQATLTAIGSPSLSQTSGFVLLTEGVEGQRMGYSYYGITGSVAAPWGAWSVLCVAPPRQRMGQNLPTGGTLGQCDGSVSIDWLAWIHANPLAVGQPFTAGDSVWVQTWYRDPPSPKTTQLSGGLRFVVCP